MANAKHLIKPTPYIIKVDVHYWLSYFYLFLSTVVALSKLFPVVVFNCFYFFKCYFWSYSCHIFLLGKCRHKKNPKYLDSSYIRTCFDPPNALGCIIFKIDRCTNSYYCCTVLFKRVHWLFIYFCLMTSSRSCEMADSFKLSVS